MKTWGEPNLSLTQAEPKSFGRGEEKSHEILVLKASASPKISISANPNLYDPKQIPAEFIATWQAALKT